MTAGRVPLSSLVSDAHGIQTGPFGSQLHANDYVDDGVGVVMPANMREGRIDHSGIARTTPRKAELLARHRLQKGDILLARRGEVGRFAVVDEAEKGWLCGTGCLRVRLSQQANPSYVAMVLESHECQKWLQRNAVGQTMLNLNGSIIADLPIAMRSLETQQLWTKTWDALKSYLANLRSLIDTKRTLKRALLDDMLSGRRRFPEFSDRPLHSRSLGVICEELSDRNGTRLGSTSVMGVLKDVGFQPMRERVRGTNGLERYKVVPPRAFAFNPMRLNIGSIAFNDLGEDILVSPDYVVFRVRSGIVSAEYVNQLRYSTRWASFMKRAGAGSVRVRIYFNDLAQLKVSVPDIDEQVRIVGVLQTIDREIRLLASLEEQGNLYKRGLLSGLMSGTAVLSP